MLHKPELYPVVSAVVDLKKTGANFTGLCPFHDEKTPSFSVKGEKFKCFGCGESGDVIDFVQKYFNLSFQDALKHLQLEPNFDPERRRKVELVSKFKTWEAGRFQELCMCIRILEKLMPLLPPLWVDAYGHLYYKLEMWKYHADILQHGSEKQKYLLYKESSDFDYRLRWT